MNALLLKIVGQILLWAGFVGATFLSVARTEVDSAPWSTVNWQLYAMFIAVGVVGIVMIRIGKAAARKSSASSTAHVADAAKSLHASAKNVAELANRLEQLTCESVIEWIDDRCVPDLNGFADNREAIANRFGPLAYAEVMTEFASGERYLNRAWSAAADGYVDEVADCIQHADGFLREACELLDKWTSTEDSQLHV